MERFLIASVLRPDRQYMVHTRVPRFVARVVELDQAGRVAPKETPVEIEAGITYRFKDGALMLCELAWVDPPPGGGAADLTRVFAAAEEDYREYMGHLAQDAFAQITGRPRAEVTVAEVSENESVLAFQELLRQEDE